MWIEKVQWEPIQRETATRHAGKIPELCLIIKADNMIHGYDELVTHLCKVIQRCIKKQKLNSRGKMDNEIEKGINYGCLIKYFFK